MKKRFLLIPTIALALTISGCNFKIYQTSSSNSEYSDITVTISRGSVELRVNQSVKLDAEAKGTVGSKELMWVSENPEIAEVNSKGYVTGKSAGTTRVSVSTPNADNSVYCDVIVNSDIRDSESSIQISKTDVTYHSIDSSTNVQGDGEQKVLVLPVYFPDDDENATEENRKFIEMSFFGSNEECGWRSFEGYYEVASYDKLHYSGYVAPDWYETNYTKQQVLDDQMTSQYIVNDALAWFKTTYPNFDLKPYDTNKDKYIDSLYIIYATDYQVDTNLWGYRWSVYSPSGTGYKAKAFSWFSLKFLKETSNYGGVPEDGSNTRIIIHEHGHMLGLPDYYDYGYTGIDCVGSFDMQAYNSFDWNAFSKYSVGWVEPYYVDHKKLKTKGSETITIQPSAFNGDCIIIPTKSWNNTPFDEYLMIELFNPELGNNEYDFNYSTYGGISDCEYGVKIFHVDARILDWNTKTGKYAKVSNFTNPPSQYSFFPNDNNDVSYEGHAYYAQQVGLTEYVNYHFLHLLQKGNESTFDKVGYEYRHDWNKDDLWRTGDTFCIGDHDGYTNYGPNFFYKETLFNDGTSLPYGIHFDEVTPDKATITFTYFE